MFGNDAFPKIKKSSNPKTWDGRSALPPKLQGSSPLPSRICYKGQSLRLVADCSQSGPIVHALACTTHQLS